MHIEESNYAIHYHYLVNVFLVYSGMHHFNCCLFTVSVYHVSVCGTLII